MMTLCRTSREIIRYRRTDSIICPYVDIVMKSVQGPLRAYVPLVCLLVVLLYVYHSGIQSFTDFSHVDTVEHFDIRRTTTILPTAVTSPPSVTTKHSNESHVVHNGTNVTSILLLTYLRSGSTFTADILQQASGMFYAYEPLKSFVPNGYYFRKGKKCLYLHYPESCSLSNDSEGVIQQVADFYTCRFTSKFLKPEKHSTAQVILKDCIKTRNTKRSGCYADMRKRCESSEVRMIKTIRLSMDLVGDLLQKIPNLKVIHLIRDPRGMFKSRMKGGYYKKFPQKYLDGSTICRRYMDDITAEEDLQLRFPKRINRVSFEDIALYTEREARRMYEFLNLNFPPQMMTWITNHTSSDRKDGYYGTTRTNSSAIANQWKEALSYDIIRRIDMFCDELYKKLGYRPFQPRDYTNTSD